MHTAITSLKLIIFYLLLYHRNPLKLEWRYMKYAEFDIFFHKELLR